MADPRLKRLRKPAPQKEEDISTIEIDVFERLYPVKGDLEQYGRPLVPHGGRPKDSRSRPRRNPQETVNMVKSSLMKSPRGKDIFRRARIAYQDHLDENPDIKPSAADLENFENVFLINGGYLNKHLVDQKTYKTRNRVRLKKHQRELPREAWGTDMDLPEEDWNKKMRRDRAEAGIGKSLFEGIRIRK